MGLRQVRSDGIGGAGRAFGPDIRSSLVIALILVPALAVADGDAEVDWQLSATGLRGLDDGQAVGVHELGSLFPSATVVEVNSERFELRFPGRVTPAVDPAVDADVAAVVSTGTLTSVVVYGPEVRASSGLGVGSTIADLAAAIPDLECTRWDPDLACSSAYGRFSYFARGPTPTVPADLSTATEFVVRWWSWTGSGRARSAETAPMKDWRAERGGIGPIDRQTRPTKANLESLLHGLGVVEQPDGKLAKFFVVSKKKAELFWLRVLSDHVIALAITSAKFPTATGVKVGMTLAEVRTLEAKPLVCRHTWSRGPAGGMKAITCAGGGVEYWFGTQAVTGNEAFVVPPPVDLDASADLVLDQIQLELP